MTEEVSSKLSLLTRKLAEVGQLKGEIADKLFEEADAEERYYSCYKM